jgi:hypothetical protein
LTAQLVQANRELFSAGRRDLPGIVIFSDDPDADPDELVELAHRLYDYKSVEQVPADLMDGVQLLRANEHGPHYHRRVRAQAGQPHYLADLFFSRAFLPGRVLTETRALRCIAQPGDVGGIELLPCRSEAGPAVTWERSWAMWNDGAVLRMAQSLADDANYADLPILGDALEEAGCDNPQILEHCRAGEPHEGDCWVIEGLLSLQPAPRFDAGQPLPSMPGS